MDTATTRPNTSRTASTGSIIAALLSAPCFIGTLLIPLGLGAVMTSAPFKFLDQWRLLFMAITVVLLVAMHVLLRRAREFRPTKFVWGVTIVAVALMLGELILDPPWARHANVPM